VVFCIPFALNSPPSHSGWLDDLKKGLEETQKVLEGIEKPPEQSPQSPPEQPPPDTPQPPSEPVVQSEPAPTQPAPQATVDKQTVKEVQQRLADLGYDPGSADGIPGAKTRQATERYQADHHLSVDGQITTALVTSLRKTLPQDKQPIVLTIDGIDITMTAIPGTDNVSPLGGIEKGRAISYLQQEPNGFNRVTWPFVQRWELAAWSGNYKATETDIRGVKSTIRLAAQLAKLKNRPFVIIAHSWGSVLAYRGIDELYREGELKKEDVDLLVTMGSPLQSRTGGVETRSRKYDGWRGVDALKESVKVWRNYWISEDWISGSIAGLGKNDIQLPYPPTFGITKVHSSYYDKQLFRDTIGLYVRSSLQNQKSTLVASTGTAVATSTQSASTDRKVHSSSRSGACMSGVCIGDTAGMIASIEWNGFKYSSAKQQGRDIAIIGISESQRKELFSGQIYSIGKSNAIIERRLKLLDKAEVFCGMISFQLNNSTTVRE